jgi:hypothetical protein
LYGSQTGLPEKRELMRIVIILLLAVASSACSQAAFRGIPWGATCEEVLTQASAWRDRWMVSSDGCQHRFLTQIAGVDPTGLTVSWFGSTGIDIGMDFRFTNGKLSLIGTTGDRDTWDTLIMLMTVLFGPFDCDYIAEGVHRCTSFDGETGYELRWRDGFEAAIVRLYHWPTFSGQ